MEQIQSNLKSGRRRVESTQIIHSSAMDCYAATCLFLKCVTKDRNNQLPSRTAA